MNFYALSLGVVAGISLAFGFLFLFIGLRREDNRRLNLTFALFALSYGGATLFAINNYAVTSVAEYVTASRLIGPFVALGWVFLVWFVAFYTGVRPRIFLLLLSIAFIVAGVVNTIGQYSIFEDILGLTFLTMPWGEQLAIGDVVEGPWSYVFLAAQLVAIFYILIASILQFRHGERQAALVLGFGLLWFVATIVVDNLVDFGVIDFIFLSDFGFLGLAIAMSLKMANDTIRTEEELEGYQQELEGLVDERTVDLEESNARLVEEIDERQQAQHSLEERVKELDTLHSIGKTLATVTDLPAALQKAEELVTDLFDAAMAYIIVPAAEDNGVKIAVGYDRTHGSVGTTPLDATVAELPLIRRVLKQGESLAVSDIRSLSLAPELLGQISERHLESALVVPLVVRGNIIGLLAVGSDRADRDFSAAEISLAETVAGDIAGAIENARLYEHAQETGAHEERDRLARDLHDAVTQTIYSATLIGEALPSVWERDPEEGQRNLLKLRQLVRGALAEMRTLLFELRPASLEHADLANLLRQLGDALTGRTRIPVEVIVDGEGDVPAEVKITVYRIAQEAFNNIAKHAGAERVKSLLRFGPDHVVLAIRDNGRGFDPEEIDSERMGVQIMRERAGNIGARLVIRSRPGQGTRVLVSWPESEEQG
jgi:signal transduction histidine kinase